MRGQSEDKELALLYAPGLLQSESPDDHQSLRDAIRQQLMPRDFIENIWIADIVEGEWETLRLRRCKVLILKMATRKAINSLLKLLFGRYDSDYVDDLAERWFTNKSVRRKVLVILRDFGLDESAIDAEALHLSMPDLAGIDRRLAELESRRDKNLRRIEDHRAGLATGIQASSDQCLDGDAVLSLERGGN